MQCILRDTFYLYRRVKDQYEVSLYEKFFVYEPCDRNKLANRTEVRLDDVIGCHVMKVAEHVTSLKSTSSFFCVYGYHLSEKRKVGLQRRERKTYVFEVDKEDTYEQNLIISRRWQSAFLWLLRGFKLQKAPECPVIIPKELPAQRHYLVIVNPKSGAGKSLEIFLNRVRPILAEADISHLLLVTERQNHARDFIKHLNLKQWSGIVLISGDGLLFEVYNGLMERPDWRQAAKIPIGIIPGGSGNGLARSISHACGEPYLSDPILACTLGLAKGRVAPLDLMKIDMPNRSPMYSFLTVGWGLMSDIDIESERLRAIGEIRFTLWAFWRVLNLRIYRGRISYLPVTQRVASPSAPRQPAIRSSTSATDCVSNGTMANRALQRRHSASAAEETKPTDVDEGAGEQETGAVDLEVVTDSLVTRAPREPAAPEDPEALDSFPALTDPVPSDWTVEEGDFVMIYSSLQSHLGTHLYFAPEARPDDGILWLLIITSNVTRFQLLNYFKQQEAGNHLSLPYVRMIPVRAFRLESYVDGGFMTVDGELVRTPTLQARVMTALGRVLTF